MNAHYKLAKVIIPLNLDKAYNYICLSPAEVGSIVRVSFGSAKYNAIIIDIQNFQNRDDKLKTIEHVYSEKFSANFMLFIRFFANYTLTPLGLVATIMLRYFSPEHELKNDLPKIYKGVISELSSDQKFVAEKILKICAMHKYETILLEGVTGCGKTEVYFEAIDYALKQNGQVLILLPEISLTKQFLDRFAKIFGFKAHSWHSTLSKKRKQDIWKGSANGDVGVVIGVRSALFLPFKNLKLIVVDEEHDSSYKQEENIFYNARDMAVARARFDSIPVILSSATPSIETMVNAQQGKYSHFILHNRFNNIKMPVLSLVDLNYQANNNKEFLSNILLEALQKNLAKKQQSILFLGRRGYAPLTLCKNCGYRISCPNCSVYMVQHKIYDALLCHYCGYSTNLPSKCQNCNIEDVTWVSVGCGIERIFEEVHIALPDARLLMLSTDLVGNIKNLRQQFQLIEDGLVDIIIGTQMVSKGHNFSNVSLVGVIDADLSLHSGDPRASEKTYQTLMQVTGRAGRTGLESVGIIQSYNPQHQTINAIIKGDQKEFYRQEIELRKQTNSPPFSRFAAIIISSSDDERAKNYARILRQHMPNYKNIFIFGPAQAPIAVLCNQYRYRILIKAQKTVNIQEYIQKTLKLYNKVPHKVNIQIDIDPQSFL